MNPNEELIRASVHDAVIRAVTEISADAKGLLEDALARETNETAKSMLSFMEQVRIPISELKAYLAEKLAY